MGIKKYYKMNWYKKAQTDLLSQLSLLDTRSLKDRDMANELILKSLEIKVGDILVSTAGMSSGIDKNYRVQSINPNFTVNLLAEESQRPMPNVNLYNYLKKNMPAWKKNELV